MKNLRIVTLYSGSRGNSTLISFMGTKILIDAGKSARALCNALHEADTDIAEISAIFITHEHSDHISALDALSKKYSIPIHITNKSASKFDKTPTSYVHRNLIRHDILFSETVGNMTVSSFQTPHDSMMSVGYRIELNGDGERCTVGYATDIGYVSESVSNGLHGCDAVILEANHDTDMLENGPYPYQLKLRIRSDKGHLSNSDSAIFASELARTGTRAFIFAHLSEENNVPDIVFDEMNSALADPSISIAIAAADIPTELELGGLL